MQVDYIRRDTPEEISENGGAYIQLVNKETIGLKSSIEEAKSTLFVVGQDSMIEGYFVGLMRSVFEGLKADGHPRTVGDVTFYPVCGGTFDLDKGWDPLVNDVRIYARLLNGLTLDITDWTFRDVTTGRVSYSIDTVSDGETSGIVSTDKNVELNGKNFPAKDLLTISWVCGEKSGTVDAAKFTANVARITIDKDAVFACPLAPVGQKASLTRSQAQTTSNSLASGLNSLGPEDNGKEIVFTVKGCYNKATKSAVVKYVAPTVVDPTIDSVNIVFQGEEAGYTFAASGANLKAAGETVSSLGGWTVDPLVARIKDSGGTAIALTPSGSAIINEDRTELNGMWTGSGRLTSGATYTVEYDLLDSAGAAKTVSKSVTYTE